MRLLHLREQCRVPFGREFGFGIFLCCLSLCEKNS